MKLEPLFYVSDLQKSIQFYSQILDFTLGKLFQTKGIPTYAPIFIGEDKLMLCLARKTNAIFYPHGLGGSGFQLFIRVEDVDVMYRKLRDKVTIIDDIASKPWGDREFTIKDPDGYLLSFYTPSI